MALSNSYDFTSTRNQAIKDALVLTGALDYTLDPEETLVTDAARHLNRMLKSWQALGVAVWVWRDVVMFTQRSKNTYILGNASDTKACYADDFIRTTNSAAIGSSDTVIPLTSATGIAVSDNIAFLNSNTLIWRTVSAVAGNNVTLSSSLGVALEAGITVYSYTNNISQPQNIITARYEFTEGITPPIFNVATKDYDTYTSQLTAGTPSQYTFRKERIYSRLQLYPIVSSERTLIRLKVQQQYTDMDAAGNEFDFPDTWHEAIVFNLASRLGWMLNVPLAKRQELTQAANIALEFAKRTMPEDTDTYFEVDQDGL